MVDRQDIDALLVSALYGELTPADEARLAAHLDSHPTDRTALADLTRARTAVRESRILEVQLDPPQSVSALLLQEAVRRAPKKVDSEKKASWFSRLMMGLVAHPAMAAAAMLVLVVGVAGTMYARHGADAFSDKTVASSHVADTEKSPAGAAPAERAQTMSPGGAGSGADNDKADPAKNADLALADRPAEADADAKQAKDSSVLAKREGAFAQGSSYQARLDEDAKPAPAKSPPAPARPATKAPSSAPHGVMIGSADKPMPRDFDERDRVAQAEPPAVSTPSPSQTATTTTPPASGAANAGFPQANSKSDSSLSMRDGVTKGGRGVGGAAPPPPAQPMAPPADKRSESEERKANEDLVWAKDQFATARALVKKQNCSGAAKVVLAIQKRAPDYYNQYVATNIDLKPCVSYIENARSLDESQKSRAKRPAPAADNAHE